MPESLQGRGFKDNEGETMPFLGGHFIPPPRPGHRRGLWQGPVPPKTTAEASRARLEGYGACTAPQCDGGGSSTDRHTPPVACQNYSKGPRATRTAARGLRPHGFQPGRREVGEEKWPPALSPVPGYRGALAVNLSPSPLAPSRSGRRQSSHPPPLPPATPESW